MKYQEKIELAKKGITFLQNGNSIGKFKEELSKRNLYKPDIDMIWQSCKSMLIKNYEREFKEQIYNQRNEYSNLNDDVYNLIKSEVIEKIRVEEKIKFNKLIDERFDEEDLTSKNKNSVLSELDIIKLNESDYKVKIKGRKKINYHIVSGVAIGIGIVFSIYTLFNPIGGKSIIFIGLIIFGIINYIFEKKNLRK